jgi:hypothetical protein
MEPDLVDSDQQRTWGPAKFVGETRAAPNQGVFGESMSRGYLGNGASCSEIFRAHAVQKYLVFAQNPCRTPLFLI